MQGESRRTITTEYRSWRGMKRHGHSLICDRWLTDYSAFLADMGRKPSPQHAVGRMDASKNFDPGNCFWSTKASIRWPQQIER